MPIKACKADPLVMSAQAVTAPVNSSGRAAQLAAQLQFIVSGFFIPLSVVTFSATPGSIGYDMDAPDLGPLGNCIIDLDDACHEARLEFRFGPKATTPEAFFADHLIRLDDAGDDRSQSSRTYLDEDGVKAERHQNG